MRYLILCFMMACIHLPAHTHYQHTTDIGCLHLAVSELALAPSIQSKLIQYNQQPKSNMTDALWQQLDSQAPGIQKVINNPAADTMRAFITYYSAQGEGLLIGLDGGLAAATDKTSDYWQQDERQFTENIVKQRTETSAFKPHTDSSTHLLLTKIGTPVYQLKAGEEILLGVLIIGFDSFMIEYQNKCSGQKRPIPPKTKYHENQ